MSDIQAGDDTDVSDIQTGDDTDADSAAATPGIDVDLTTLSGTMVYSEVFNMITNPEDYVYPDDYPDIDSEICVVGVFDTYPENGFTYCTLKEARFLYQ